MKTITTICMLSVLICSCGVRTSSIYSRPLTDTMITELTQELETWKGEYIFELIRAIGTPGEIVSDGGTGKIYIYSYFTEEVRRGIIEGFTGDTENDVPFSLYNARVMIWVDSWDLINHWRLEYLLTAGNELMTFPITDTDHLIGKQ